MSILGKLFNAYCNLCYFFLKPITKTIEWKELNLLFSQTDQEISVPAYLSGMIFAVMLSTIIAFPLFFTLAPAEFLSDAFAFFIPLFLPIGVLMFFFVKPYLELSMKKKAISALLPLAILTMSATVESGAPPQYMFRGIASSNDYPKLSEEFRKLERYMKTMGMSFSEAMSVLEEQTPSLQLKRFLTELNTTIKTGGDLKEFMKKRADKAYFEYTIAIEQASKRAETFGDIYTAVVIAGPLFLFSAVMMMGFFSAEGTFLGMSTEAMLTLGIFLMIPIINIVFIILMEVLTPESI